MDESLTVIKLTNSASQVLRNLYSNRFSINIQHFHLPYKMVAISLSIVALALVSTAAAFPTGSGTERRAASCTFPSASKTSSLRYVHFPLKGWFAVRDSNGDGCCVICILQLSQDGRSGSDIRRYANFDILWLHLSKNDNVWMGWPGANVRFDRGSGACTGQKEGGDKDAVFILQEGSTLQWVPFSSPRRRCTIIDNLGALVGMLLSAQTKLRCVVSFAASVGIAKLTACNLGCSLSWQVASSIIFTLARFTNFGINRLLHHQKW